MSDAYIAVRSSLRQDGAINEYTDEGAARKAAMHRDGKTLLKKLAEALGLSSSEYRLSSNKAGIAVAGEVTLHADNLYVQLCDVTYGHGLRLLYRSCTSRTDYSGGHNNYVTLADFNEEEDQPRIIARMRALMKAAQAEAVPA